MSKYFRNELRNKAHGKFTDKIDGIQANWIIIDENQCKRDNSFTRFVRGVSYLVQKFINGIKIGLKDGRKKQ